MGHAALGILLALPLLVAKRGTAGRDALGLTPGLLLVVMLSANLPDAIHVADLRVLSHNLLAWFALSLALGLLFRRRLDFDRRDVAAIVLTGLAHPAGDLAFGAYHPFYPLQGEPVTLGPWPWNGPEDLALELALSLLVLVVLFHARLAGRRMQEAWKGRDDWLARLAAWGTILLLAANLAVFALMNLVYGWDPSIVAVALFLAGTAMGVPLLRFALTARKPTQTALSGAYT